MEYKVFQLYSGFISYPLLCFYPDNYRLCQSSGLRFIDRYEPAAAAIMSYPLLFCTGCTFSLRHASKPKCLFCLKFLIFILYVVMSNLSFNTLCYLLTKVRCVLPCFAFLSQSQIMDQSHSIDEYALAVSLSSVGSLIQLFTPIIDKPRHSSHIRPR